MLEEWMQAPVLVGTTVRVFDRALTEGELEQVHELNMLDLELERVFVHG